MDPFEALIPKRFSSLNLPQSDYIMERVFIFNETERNLEKKTFRVKDYGTLSKFMGFFMDKSEEYSYLLLEEDREGKYFRKIYDLSTNLSVSYNENSNDGVKWKPSSMLLQRVPKIGFEPKLLHINLKSSRGSFLFLAIRDKMEPAISLYSDIENEEIAFVSRKRRYYINKSPDNSSTINDYASILSNDQSKPLKVSIWKKDQR